MAAIAAAQAHSRRDVCRWLGISERQLRAWEKQEFVPALETYSFKDLAALRILSRFRESHIPAPRIRLALKAMRERWSEAGDPLTEMRVYSDGRKIHVQFAGQRMEPVSGQILFDFDAAAIGALVSFPAPVSPPKHRRQQRREAETWFEKGLTLEQSGAPLEEIVEAYQQAAKIDPASAGALVNLGTVYFNVRKWRLAERFYKMALDVDAQYSLAHFNLANLYDERGQRDKALSHYLAALRIQPNYADAHYNLALLYQATRQHLLAVRHWKSYLKLDSGSQWAGIARQELDKLCESTIVRGARRE